MPKGPNSAQKDLVARIMADSAASRGVGTPTRAQMRSNNSVGLRAQKKADKLRPKVKKAQSIRAYKEAVGNLDNGFNPVNSFLEVLDTGRANALGAATQAAKWAAQGLHDIGLNDDPEIPETVDQQGTNYALSALQDAHGGNIKPNELMKAYPEEYAQLKTAFIAENGKQIHLEREQWRRAYEPSWGDFRRMANEHETFSQAINQTSNKFEEGTTTPDADIVKNAPWGVNFALGMAGDAAFDPLSKVRGARALEGSKEKVASSILKQSDDLTERLAERGVRAPIAVDGGGTAMTAGRAKAEEIASKVLKSGKSALSKDDLELLGVKGGVKFHVPGGREFTVVPKGVTDLINRPAAGVVRAIGDTKPATNLRKLLSGATPEMNEAIRNGSIDMLETKRMSRFRNAEAQALTDRMQQNYAKLSRKFKGQGEDVVRAIEGDESALARLAANGRDDAAEGVAAIISDLAAAMKAAGVPLAEREQYFPRMLTPEARAATMSGQALDGGTPFFLKGRHNVEGHVLSDGTVLAGPEYKIRDVVERWAKEEGLPSGFYEKNPDKVMPAYIAAVNKRIAKQQVVNDLIAKGIARSAKEAVEIIDTTSIAGIRKRAREAIREGLKGEKAAEKAGAAREEAAATRAQGAASAPDLRAVESELLDTTYQQTAPDFADILGDGQRAIDDSYNPQPFDNVTRQEAQDAATREQAAAWAARDREVKGAVREQMGRKVTSADELSDSLKRHRAAQAPEADAIVKGHHDKLYNDPVRREGLANVDNADLFKYMDKFERGVKAAEKADPEVRRLFDLAETEILQTGNLTKAERHLEAALTRMHDLGSGTTLGQRADEVVERLRDVTPGTPAFNQAVEDAKASLAPFDQMDEVSDDVELIWNYLGGDGGGVSDLTSYEGREAFKAAETARIDALRASGGGVGAGTPHADMFAVTQFEDAVDMLDNYSPGWRTRDTEAIFGPMPEGAPEFKGGPTVAADAAAGPVEREAFAIMDATHPANIKMAEVQGAVQAEVKRARAALADAQQRIEDGLLLPTNEELAAQIEDLQARRVKLLEKVERETDANARRAGVLESRALDAEAKALAHNRKGGKLLGEIADMPTTKQVEQLIDGINEGAYKTLTVAPDVAAPAEIAEILNKVKVVNTAEGMRTFLKHYDNLLNYIKAWQISTPGFHVRNMLGGVFNNYLDNVVLSDYKIYLKDQRAWEKGASTNPLMDELMTVVSRGQYSADEIATGQHIRGSFLGINPSIQSVNPLSRKNAWLQANTAAGGKVEEILRGALGYKVMRDGGTIDDALEAIQRYHFDYADLSDFERKVKRVIPFYTWTRKNFPLQVEMMLSNPGKYSKFYVAKKNLELQAGPPEDVVPNYYDDLFAVHTPIKIGGQDAYLTPDLPFTQTMTNPLPFDSEGNFDPFKSAEMITPIIKTPLERIQSHQYFKDIPFTDQYSPMPERWKLVPGLEDGLKAVGWMDSKGRITDRTAYTIEQYMPLLGRMRRLSPSEKRFEDRGTSTWLSFIGIPLRVNTEYDKKLEKKRVKYLLQRMEDERLGKTATFEIAYNPDKKKKKK